MLHIIILVNCNYSLTLFIYRYKFTRISNFTTFCFINSYIFLVSNGKSADESIKLYEFVLWQSKCKIPYVFQLLKHFNDIISILFRVFSSLPHRPKCNLHYFNVVFMLIRAHHFEFQCGCHFPAQMGCEWKLKTFSTCIRCVR